MMTTTPIDLQLDADGYIFNATCYTQESIVCHMDGTTAPVLEKLHSIDHKEAFDNYWFMLDSFNIEEVFAAVDLVFGIAAEINAREAEYNRDALDGFIAAHNLHVWQSR